MRLPSIEHTSRPWRIHEITQDFRLYDVWALATPGGPDDFPRLVAQIPASKDDDLPSPVARALFAIRWKLGEWFHWDDPDTGLGARVPSLRDRLPQDLREGPQGPVFDDGLFTSLFVTENEWASEAANKTVHGVMHVSWVPDGDGYRGQLAVLVKPNGWFGKAYMAAIGPFRHLIVYPPLMRQIEHEWAAR